MKIRMHRGSLADSMETAKEIEPTVDGINGYLMQNLDGFWFTSMTITPYGGVDPRTGWDTHVLSLDGKAVAFTDGPL